MKVIMISGDPKILSVGSNPYNRMKKYSSRVEHLFVIVTSKSSPKKVNINEGNLSIVYVGGWSIFRLLNLYFKTLRIAFENKKNDCILTSQDPFYLGTVATKVSKLLSLPLEVQVHTDLYKTTKGLLNIHKKMMAKFNLYFADSVRTVSNNAKESILNITNIKEEKIVVNSIYVDLGDVCSAKWDDENNTILMVSRLEKEKNIPLAIEILKGVLERVPNAKLNIIGDGSEKGHIENIIKENNLTEKVFLKGYMKDVRQEYCRAKVFLHTSEYEGYGMALMEAALSGLPIVSTFVGIAPELTHTCFSETDKRKAVEHLVYIIEDMPSWERQSKYVREKSKEFLVSEEEYVDNIILNWKKILSI